MFLVLWIGGPGCSSRLHDQVQSAILAGKASEVQSEARWLLRLRWIDPLHSESVSDAHVALGLGALERDDIATAGEHLLEAARASNLPTLNPVGVGGILARALLAHGERDAVLAYLDACRVPGARGARDLARWSQDVRAGRSPDFGPTLLH